MKPTGNDNQQITPRAIQADVWNVVSAISLLCILPLASVIAEMNLEEISLHWILVGKWFLFWASGIRLFTAGIRQASNPELIATRLASSFRTDSFSVIRELGFANIALGSMGILSQINEHWRLLAAIASTLFFGLMALQGISRKPDRFNEYVALVYNSTVFIVLALFCVLIFPQLG